jgi:hypothetical protein
MLVLFFMDIDSLFFPNDHCFNCKDNGQIAKWGGLDWEWDGHWTLHSSL